ncbi:MAG: hypothetical protein HC850_06400 [Rhodomicrobium sp.]|nr:hypothetical protein [Rhodomicrobium sp.]
MKRRLIVHLGLHKTGSTSLQYVLHDNMQQLYDLGFLYPGTGRHPRSHVQHVLLARAFRNPDEVRAPGGFGLAGDIDRELISKALLHEIDLSGRTSIILSSEEFSAMDAESVARFYRQFQSFDVVPVLYVRNFPALAGALYQTYVTHSGVTDDFAAFEWKLKIRTDLPGICRDWASGAFNRKIIVRNYDVPGLDILQDFASVAGIDTKQLCQTYTTVKLNRTLKPAIVMILRELRARRVTGSHIDAVRDRLKGIGHERTKRIVALLNDLRQEIQEGKIYDLLAELAKVPFREPQSLLPASLRAQIMTEYEQQIAQLKSFDFVDFDRRAAPKKATDQQDAVFIGNLDHAIDAIGDGGGANERARPMHNSACV